ncbi:MAG: hypothetical protein IKW33_00910 [Clostridia bacterium]|nr:hypothetical protein [Clostridia bacterium]
MKTLKKLFPLSFNRNKTFVNFIISLLIYLVIGAVATLLIGFAGTITGWIPIAGDIILWALRIIGAIVDLYVVIGIIIQILAFLKIIK